MKKKLVSLVLAAGMAVSLLAGCGSSSTGGDAAPAASTGSAAEEAGDAAEAPALSEETEELHMIMITVGFNLEDSGKVQDAINEYIEPLIHATVNMEWLDLGEYLNQMNLKLTSGEAIDIMPAWGTQLSNLYGQEALMDLTDLMANYGQDIAAAVGEDYLKCGEINGRQYALPIMTAFAQEDCLLYRTDIAEELGLDFSNVKTLADLTPLLEKVHEAYPEYTVICANSTEESQLREWAWDGLGDEYGVLMDAANDTTITNLYETEEYKEYVTLMHEWYTKGLVMTDAATTAENLTTIFDSGIAFGTIAKNYPGNIESKFGMSQYPFAAISLSDPLASTNYVTSNVMTIPSTATHPEKAMAFLNLLYTDVTLQNLMCYGIEGEHYRVIDAEKGTIDYLEGENMMTCKYVSKYLVGNPLIAYNDFYTPEGIHDTLLEYNANATKSKALGFSYDSADVANELSALSNVVAKYRRGLECGSLDPETELPKFIEELKGAGIETVIEAKQAQYDAWLAEQ